MDLLQAEERHPFVRINLIPGSDGSSTVITGVIPADFDGDSYMDLLITRKPKGKPDDPVKAQIYWGTSGSPGLGTILGSHSFFKIFGASNERLVYA